ncbi:MAG: ABC transporter substrate-binding protein [Chloroflexi bacterium]|nr:ABC transporter substrate-binding protein [Chloroflexota bacterium]
MVTLEAPAVRVVCLTGLCVDTMFVLGIKPVAAYDLLHLDEAYWGPDENEIGAISGSFFEPSLEDIAKAEPDLVIGLGGVHEGLRPSLASIAPLFIVDPIGVEGMLSHVIEVGILLGMEEEATAAAAAFEVRLGEYVSRVATKRSVMVVYGSDVNIGAETVCTPAIDALARAADYYEEFTDCGVHGAFPSFSVEQLLSIDPEVIFVQTFGFGPEPPQPVSEQLVDNVIWSELRAVQNGEVYEVDFFIWGTSRGIRGTNVVLDEAMPRVYPEVFPAPLP